MLDAPYKLLWFYILDDCNHAGIWEVDMEVASLRTGEKLSELYALEVFRLYHNSKFLLRAS